MPERYSTPLPINSSDTGLSKSQKQKTISTEDTHFCAIFIASRKQNKFYKQMDKISILCYNCSVKSFSNLFSPIVRKEFLK
jgi:hypothetical protein